MRLYKITFLFSFFIFLLLFIVSIVLNHVFSSCEIWQFWFTWISGIGCSAVVVAVASLIQFKFEQKKAITKLIKIIHAIFFVHNFTGKAVTIDFQRNEYNDKEHSVGEKNWQESITRGKDKMHSILSELDSFTKNAKIKDIKKIINKFHFDTFDSEISYDQKNSLLRKEYIRTSNDFLQIAQKTNELNHVKDLHKIIEDDINLQKKFLDNLCSS